MYPQLHSSTYILNSNVNLHGWNGLDISFCLLQQSTRHTAFSRYHREKQPNVGYKQVFFVFSYLLHYPEVLHLVSVRFHLRRKQHFYQQSIRGVSHALKQVLLYSGDNPSRALTREMFLQMWESVPLENIDQVLLCFSLTLEHSGKWFEDFIQLYSVKPRHALQCSASV